MQRQSDDSSREATGVQTASEASAMRSRSAPVAAFVGAACATALSIFFLDRPAASFAHVAFGGWWGFVALTHIVDPVLPLAAIGLVGLGGGLALGWTPPPWARVTLSLCVATLLAIVVKDQLKYAFGRTWPETWINGNPSLIRDGVMAFVPFHGGPGWASFPSGHTTTAVAPAAALAMTTRSASRWLAVVPALLVAIGLYGADYHFVADILAGAMVGCGCAAIAVAMLGGLLATEPPQPAGGRTGSTKQPPARSRS